MEINERTSRLSAVFLGVFFCILSLDIWVSAAWNLERPVGKRQKYQSIKFQENLSITQDAWFPFQIYVDHEKNIYALCAHSRKEQSWIKFDHQGKEISRRQIIEGQGPGEFQSFEPVFTQDGRVFVADWPQRRLTIMDRSFKIEKIAKLDLYGACFNMDSKGNMYFLAYKAAKMRSQNRVVLTKCDPGGRILKEYTEYEWGPREKGDGTYEDDLFRTQMKYALDQNDNLYYVLSNKYEIQVIDPDGLPSRRITRDIKPRRVTQEDLDKRLPDKTSRIRYKYIIPDHVPSVADIFPLKNGGLLVITFEKGDDKAFLIGDLIDNEGNFVESVRVPKYFNWDFLLAPARSRALCLGDDFYAIESDADEEKFWIKRYRITWE